MHGHNNTPLARYDFGGRLGVGGWGVLVFLVMFCDDLLLFLGWGGGGDSEKLRWAIH